MRLGAKKQPPLVWESCSFAVFGLLRRREQGYPDQVVRLFLALLCLERRAAGPPTPAPDELENRARSSICGYDSIKKLMRYCSTDRGGCQNANRGRGWWHGGGKPPHSIGGLLARAIAYSEFSGRKPGIKPCWRPIVGPHSVWRQVLVSSWEGGTRYGEIVLTRNTRNTRKRMRRKIRNMRKRKICVKGGYRTMRATVALG
jgi:hypothetical protein